MICALTVRSQEDIARAEWIEAALTGRLNMIYFASLHTCSERKESPWIRGGGVGYCLSLR